MEAFIWAATDPHLGVAVSTRVFGSIADAKRDAQEAIGEASPVEWTCDYSDQAQGHFVDGNGNEQHVAVQLVKVNL